MNILFIGDIVGKPGLDYTTEVLSELIPEMKPDLVVANAENVTKGKGLSRRDAEALYDAGVEIITLGNHTFDQKELAAFIDEDERIIRPANYPPNVPGRGYTICRVNGKQVLIANLMGRTFMGAFDCPFRSMDSILAKHSEIRHVILDMHAETTSEKLVMGWYLNGRVSAVVGTHTHVPTADARILPDGTAYITDVGMVGPRDGILGMGRKEVTWRMMSQMPVKFSVADGARQFCAVLLKLDDISGKAMFIEQIQRAEKS
jgi:2',3'-cyclic-nucleotide 2'-phosphodiesterase